MVPRLIDVPDLVGGAAALVFDKDGTLLDLDSRWVVFFTALTDAVLEALDATELRGSVLEALGVGSRGLVPHGVAAAGTGADVRAVIDGVLSAAGYSGAGIDAEIASAYLSAPMGTLAPLGDPARVLTQLRDAGRRVGVATADDRERTLDDLDRLGVAHLVELLNCGDDRFSKPHPRVLLDMAESWEISIDGLVMVGDSGHDLATARAAGSRFIAVSASDLVGADAWVETVDEIGEALVSSISGD